MKKLILSELESDELLKNGVVLIVRNGFDMLVEVNNYFDQNEKETIINRRYNVVILDCYSKVVVKSNL